MFLIKPFHHKSVINKYVRDLSQLYWILVTTIKPASIKKSIHVDCQIKPFDEVGKHPPLLNPFVPNAPFLYPLPSGSRERVQWEQMAQWYIDVYDRQLWLKFLTDCPLLTFTFDMSHALCSNVNNWEAFKKLWYFSTSMKNMRKSNIFILICLLMQIILLIT